MVVSVLLEMISGARKSGTPRPAYNCPCAIAIKLHEADLVGHYLVTPELFLLSTQLARSPRLSRCEGRGPLNNAGLLSISRALRVPRPRAAWLPTSQRSAGQNAGHADIYLSVRAQPDTDVRLPAPVLALYHYPHTSTYLKLTA